MSSLRLTIPRIPCTFHRKTSTRKCYPTTLQTKQYRGIYAKDLGESLKTLRTVQCKKTKNFKLEQSQLSQDHQNQQELSNSIQSQKHPDEILLPTPPHRQDKHYGPLYNSRPTNNRSLELFIDDTEKDLFNPTLLVLTRPNISKREHNELKEIRSWNDQTVRVQDKGSRLVI